MDRFQELKQNNNYIEECDNLSWEIKMKVWIYFQCAIRKHLLYQYLEVKNTYIKLFYPEHIPQYNFNFDNFCKNIKYINIGNTWKEQNYAQKDWLEFPYDSLYYWYWRFKNKEKWQ